MSIAVFKNGAYESVLQDVINAQTKSPDGICYLQPYSQSKIAKLEEYKPTTENPIPIYFSTTDALNHISYKAYVVGWENKHEMTEERLEYVNKQMETYQTIDTNVFLEVDGKKPINLLSVQHMKKLILPVSVLLVRKLDGSFLKRRTRAGNWAYIEPLSEDLEKNEAILEDELEEEHHTNVADSLKDSSENRIKRLSQAQVLPERVQVVSTGFKRNADVVAEVLYRANGVCESCRKPAPFNRASDGSPYLEIHHVVTLANDGEDTVANAVALCPNCHRREHYG